MSDAGQIERLTRKRVVQLSNDTFALETKLAKYKQIKQCMMQELLTGSIRLV